jgi:hypothetical protein
VRTGAVVRGGPYVWGAQNCSRVPGNPQAARGPVDVRAGGWREAHEQCGRTRPSSAGVVTQRELWDADSTGVAFCRSDDDDGGNTQAAASQCPRLYARGMPSSPGWGTHTVVASQADVS